MLDIAKKQECYKHQEGQAEEEDLTNHDRCGVCCFWTRLNKKVIRVEVKTNEKQ